MFANCVTSADVQDDIDMRKQDNKTIPFHLLKAQTRVFADAEETTSRWVGSAAGCEPDAYKISGSDCRMIMRSYNIPGYRGEGSA